MKILRHPELDEREFGRAAIGVDELRSWAERERLWLPRTAPSLDEFDAVQLESLLSALGAGAADYAGDTTTDSQILDAARAMLKEDEEQGVNPKVREMIEQDRSVQLARWYVGGRVHVHWRRKLEGAINDGALQVFDALTGLPLRQPVTVQPTASSHTAPTDAPLLSTGEVAFAFRDIHFDQSKWQRNLEDPANWLLQHRKAPGKKGNQPVQARWDALGIAKALATKHTATCLNPLRVRFKTEPLLKQWRADWDDFDLSMNE